MKIFFKENKIDLIIIILLTIIFFLASYILQLLIHESFGTPAQDLGVYDQGVWLLSQFQDPQLTSFYKPISLWAIHFEPVLYLAAFLYRIYDSVNVLFFLQSFFLALAIPPIFLLAKKVLKSRVIAIMVCIALIIAPGIQSAILFTFHTTVLYAGIIAWAFYFAYFKKFRLLIPILLLMLLVKEDGALYALFFGIYIGFKHKAWKYASITILTSVFWAILSLKWAIPLYGDGKLENFVYGQLGSNVGDAILFTILHPLETIRIFFEPIKIKVGIIIFTLLHGGFGFLILPLELLLLIPMFVIRYFSPNDAFWNFAFHYSLPSIVMAILIGIVAMGRMEKLRIFSRFKILKYLSAIVGLAAIIFMNNNSHFAYRPAWSYFVNYVQLIYNGKYKPQKTVFEAISLIPKDASVCAQQNIEPHLTHRQNITWLGSPMCNGEQQYTILDTKTNYWPLSENEYLAKIDELKSRNDLIYQKDTTMLFVRKN